MKKFLKKSLAVFTASSVMVTGAAGCGSSVSTGNADKVNIEDSGNTVSSSETDNTQTDKEKSINEVGVFTGDKTTLTYLSDDQYTVAQYFGDNYISFDKGNQLITAYQFIQRHANQLVGTKIKIWGYVEKIIEKTDTYYTAKVNIRQNEKDYLYGKGEYEKYKERTKDDNIIVKININSSKGQYMQGDYLCFYCLYEANDVVSIDGISNNYPILSSTKEVSYSDYKEGAYSIKEVKNIAKLIFGNDIEIRNATDEDRSETKHKRFTFKSSPFYVCDLENAKNSKFTQFYFGANTGAVVDANADVEKAILRDFRVSPDLSKYIFFTYNSDTTTLGIGVYDRNLNKLWEREFENTETCDYDFTNNAIYLNADNEVYFMNLEDGTDIVSPCRTGRVDGVYKIPDGIILVTGQNKKDAVMKLNMDGKIEWTCSFDVALNYFNLNYSDGKILISSCPDLFDGIMWERLCVIDSGNGNVLYDQKLEY